MYRSVEEVEELLRSYLSRAMDVDNNSIDPNRSLAYLGVDSVLKLGLLAECETLSERRVTIEQFEQCGTVRMLALSIANRPQ